MDIVLTESQRMLKQSARDFLQRECPKELVRAMEKDERGYPPALWSQMASLGWLGMPFPAAYGGSDGDFFDLALLMEELGYAAAPTPFFSSIILAGQLLDHSGTDEQKRALIPQLASGELLLTLAYHETDGGFDGGDIRAVARAEGSGFVVSGTKLFVQNAHTADRIIIAARTQETQPSTRGLSFLLIDPKACGVSLRPMVTTAGDKQFEVVLDDVQVAADAVVGGQDSPDSAFQGVLLRATALKCAEMVGGAQAVLDLTVEYVKGRVQFGRPIGSFQAVQHHCVDMYRDLEMGRILAYQACWLISQDLPAEQAVSTAKLKLSRAYPAITRMAHQVTGGVGYYTEYPLELYTRRALAAAVSLGGPDTHARNLTRGLGGSSYHPPARVPEQKT